MAQLKNTDQSFGLVARSFHWFSAFIILGLLGMGFWMVSLDPAPFKFELYTWHKSFGMIVLGLGVMRLLWRFMSLVPQPEEGHPVWERFLAKTIHIVFYISILGMPLSGWVMSSAGEYSVSFFHLFDFPQIVGKNEQAFEATKLAHELFSYGLIAAIGLHIVGALKHQIIDRDETMRRMGANVFVAFLGLGLLGVPAFFIAQNISLGKPEVQKTLSAKIEHVDPQVSDSGHEIQKWAVDSQGSEIAFSFTQYGQVVSGFFESWSGDIYFDPQKLDQSTVNIMIDPASIRTGSADRDVQAQDGEWFSVGEFPSANFKSESFRHLEANHYEVSGQLTLRGVDLPIKFPFILDIEENDSELKKANMVAKLSLNRHDFGIGQGQWKSGETIGNMVDIEIKVGAKAPLLRP